MMRKILFIICTLIIIAAIPMLNYSAAYPTPTAAEIFKLELKLLSPDSFAINWLIKDGYFLYKQKIKIHTKNLQNVHIGNIHLPANLIKIDKYGRSYEIYRHQLSIVIPSLGLQAGEEILAFQFQGCGDNGLCYPPENRQIVLTIDKNLALAAVHLEEPTPQLTAPPQLTTNFNQPNDGSTKIFANNFWLALISFFGFGLLLSVTPCVLPMVPVISAIIAGYNKNISLSRACWLSISYVVSMAITFAIIGLTVALIGKNIQIEMQSPWIISLVSLLLIYLAFSMFGLYEVHFPTGWHEKLTIMRLSSRNGSYLKAAALGSLSTLVLSPCVTPPLVGILGYIANTGNIAFGAVALFCLGLGMGTPLLLLGASLGKWLPKTGAWMQGITAFFGILLLATAIYLISRIIPAVITMWLWASLFIGAGIYYGTFPKIKSSKTFNWQNILSRTSGVLLCSYGLLILIGVRIGNTNFLQTITGQQNITSVANNKSIMVRTIADLKQAIKQAHGKQILINFYADWCASCQIIENYLFKNPRVIAALENFVLLKIDITAYNTQDKNLLRQFNIVAPPALLFLNQQGKERADLRLVGAISASKFLDQLKLAEKSI